MQDIANAAPRLLSLDEISFVSGGGKTAAPPVTAPAAAAPNPTSFSQMSWYQAACYTTIAGMEQSDTPGYSSEADQACGTNLSGTNPGGGGGDGSGSGGGGGNYDSDEFFHEEDD